MTTKCPDPAPSAGATTGTMQFDARVEPYWKSFNDRKGSMGIFEQRREKKRHLKLLEGIDAAFTAGGLTPAKWDTETGDAVCHIKIDKLGVFQDLKQYAANLENTSADDIISNWSLGTRFPHLLRHRERNSYYIPVEFSHPFRIQREEGDNWIPVGSVFALAAELGEINRSLKVQDSFQIKKMVNFLRVTENDIARFESRTPESGKFWLNFSFMVIQKLARKAMEHEMPIIFA